LNAIEISVNIELQQRGGMIAWPTRRLRLNSIKAQVAQSKLVDENIDRPNRVVVVDIIVQQLRK
jgi:hypothetical protein